MTAFISWNIQWGRGVDGKIDLQRIAHVLKAMGDADIICLQEVARFVPEIDDGTDQVTALADLFPGFSPFFGAAIDRIGGKGGLRQAFGNLVLTRLPALQVFHHPLPQPVDPSVKKMPRQAAELIVDTPRGPLRVMTTHLEYFSSRQRDAQIEHLRALHAEAGAGAQAPRLDVGQGIFSALSRPVSLLLCGDFNCRALSAQYQRIITPFPDGIPGLCDAWPLVYPQQPHAPTCGVFDSDQWQEGPHCRDFFFVSEDIASRVSAVEVNVDTDASDHQPLYLVLAE